MSQGDDRAVERHVSKYWNRQDTILTFPSIPKVTGLPKAELQSKLFKPTWQ